MALWPNDKHTGKRRDIKSLSPKEKGDLEKQMTRANETVKQKAAQAQERRKQR